VVGAIVGSGVGGVVFPVVGRHAVAALAVKGDVMHERDGRGSDGGRVVGNDIVGAITIREMVEGAAPTLTVKVMVAALRLFPVERAIRKKAIFLMGLFLAK
jgi:hypothetical protein